MREKNKSRLFILIGIISLGVLIRILKLDLWSLRLDEAQSIWQASHSPAFIIQHQLRNIHMPLHNLLLHAWMSYLGSHTITVRTLAAIFGILCLPCLYLLGRELFNKKVALLATFIGAISPFWVWQSRENRMYSLLSLTCILSTIFYVKIIKKPKLHWWFLYTTINAIGVYIHYFYWAFLLIQALFFLLAPNQYFSQKKTRLFLILASSATISTLIFTPWLVGLYWNYGTGSQAPTLPVPSPHDMVLTLFEFTFGSQPTEINTLALSLWPIVILLGFIFLEKRARPPLEIYLSLLGITVPIALTYLLSVLVRPAYLTRYLSITTHFFYLSLAWFLLSFKTQQLRNILITIFTLLVSTALINQQISPISPLKENYRDAALYISQHAEAHDIVALAPPYIIYSTQYYYRGKAPWTTVPNWDRRKGGIPELTREQLVQSNTYIKLGHEKLWLLLSSDLAGTQEVKKFFDSRYPKLQKVQFSHHLWLNVYLLKH